MTKPIVLLQSYPRSGNTLVRHVIEDVFGVRTLTVHPNEGTTSALWSAREANDKFDTEGPVSFIKTHESKDYQNIPHKTIYIVRDGRDVLLSYAHFLADFRSSIVDRWRVNLRKLIGGHILHWGDHVTQLQPKADAVIRFEELVTNPVAYVQEALWRVGVLDLMPEPAAERLPDFSTLHDKAPKFYRKGTAGQWRGVFSPELVSRFWEVHGEGMEMAGYERESVFACH